MSGDEIDDVSDLLERVLNVQGYKRCNELFQRSRREFVLELERPERADGFIKSVSDLRESTLESLCLSDACDCIGAHYVNTFHAGGQRVMVFDDTPYEDAVGEHWRAWFLKEVNDLTRSTGPFLMAILSVVVYRDEEPLGWAAAEYLSALLRNRYGLPASE
jgi:hypothetical protein